MRRQRASERGYRAEAKRRVRPNLIARLKSCALHRAGDLGCRLLNRRDAIPRSASVGPNRNGPNPQFAPRDANHHWFIGDGMIHAFHIADGRVSYRNRWVRTPKWELEHKAHRALFGSWGNPATTDPSVQGKDGGVAKHRLARR
jgi:hypothetical protein